MDTVTSPPQSPPKAQSAAEVLGAARQRSWWRRPFWWSVAALVALVAVGLYLWYARQTANAAPQYITQTVSRGNLTLTVTANGTLEPTRSVDIGSELSGTVSRVFADVNDRVKKGQVLVELDTSKLRDQVLRSRAALAAANAKVEQSAATVKEARASLARLQEVSELSGGKVPSKTELDSAQATLDRALADESSARAAVGDAKAALSTDETNLSKASIRSPIDGVVLTRNVEPGNAVAASLQAVTLLTLAEDLTHMRLEVSVDEADVGSIKAGQPATFTVSAYPGRKYPATITKVSFGSTITENVVTYVTYLNVENTDLSLRPGMTATATITAAERRDVLLVPNTALRFTPSLGTSAKESSKGGGLVSSLMPRPPRDSTPKTSASTSPSRQVWVLRDGAAVAVPITAGITDGRMTEVTGGDLEAGMQVITDQSTRAGR